MGHKFLFWVVFQAHYIVWGGVYVQDDKGHYTVMDSLVCYEYSKRDIPNAEIELM